MHVKVHSPFGFLSGEMVKTAVGGVEVKTATADQLETWRWRVCVLSGLPLKASTGAVDLQGAGAAQFLNLVWRMA